MADINVLLETTNTTSSINSFTDILFNVVVTNVTLALLIIVIGLFTGQLIKKLILKFFKEFHINEIIYSTNVIQTKIDELVASIVAWFIYVFAILFSLRQLGLATVIVNIIFAFILLIILVLIFLSFKDFIPNLLAGLIIHKKKYMKKNDEISLHLVKGKVETVDLLHTHIITRKGDSIRVPNSYIIKHRLTVKKT